MVRDRSSTTYWRPGGGNQLKSHLRHEGQGRPSIPGKKKERERRRLRKVRHGSTGVGD